MFDVPCFDSAANENFPHFSAIIPAAARRFLKNFPEYFCLPRCLYLCASGECRLTHASAVWSFQWNPPIGNLREHCILRRWVMLPG